MDGVSGSLEERMAEVEARLGVVENLAALADADLVGVAAQGKVVRALAKDMGEIKATLRGHGRDIAELKAGQGAILGLLEELIRRDDDRRLGDDGVGE